MHPEQRARAIRESIAGAAVAGTGLVLLLVSVLGDNGTPEYRQVCQRAGWCLLATAATWVATAWISALPEGNA